MLATQLENSTCYEILLPLVALFSVIFFFSLSSVNVTSQKERCPHAEKARIGLGSTFEISVKISIEYIF